MKTIIGLTGDKRAGKGTFGKFLAELAAPKTVSVVHSGDILKETLAVWGIEPTRSNLQNLAIIMDEKYGAGTLTNAVKKKLLEQNSDIVIYDGVRWLSDEEMVRGFEKNFIVYITADVKLRFERGRSSGEKAGEDKATFEQFMKEEGAYTEKFIAEIGSRADFKITNEGTLEEYKKEVRKFLELYLL